MADAARPRRVEDVPRDHLTGEDSSCGSDLPPSLPSLGPRCDGRSARGRSNGDIPASLRGVCRPCSLSSSSSPSHAFFAGGLRIQRRRRPRARRCPPGYLQTWPRCANITTRAERAGASCMRAVAPSFDFHPSPHRPAHAQVRSGQHPRRGTRPETATYADHLCVLTLHYSTPCGRSTHKSVCRRREEAEDASLGLNLPRPSRLEHDLTPHLVSSSSLPPRRRAR